MRADRIIDPEHGGDDKPVSSEVEGGGEIVAVGVPEDVVKVERSYTGRYLKPLLGKSKVVPRPGKQHQKSLA